MELEHQGTAVLDKGTRLGNYEIERLVGVGSMCAVYECRHTETGHRFAIKVLSPALAAVPAARTRFLKEARMTARVRHPHVVEVTDVGEDDGQGFLVMAMLEGEDLSSRLEGFGSLSAAETVAIMLPVCEGVAEAHACGVTHRDLKPSNIFLTIRDQQPHPIVIDFGIAKDEDAASIWDAAGPGRRPVFGTPYYLAPEQVGDHRAAGPASDQHALGVILYECLTGQPPYRGDSVEKLFRAIAAGNPIPPSVREPDVSEGLDAVVLRALATDPNERFASVSDLARALRPFASKTPAPTPAVYQRKPSSPAILAEASTRSPFVRTLTPEVEALSGSWFDAQEVPQASAGELALLPPDASDAEPPLWTRLPEEKPASRRIWIGAAAGVAASVVLVLVATRGSSSSARSPETIPARPAEAVVQVEPAPAKPSTQNLAVAPAAAEPPAEPMPVQVAAPPAAAPSAPPAPAPNEPPAPAASAPTAVAPSVPAVVAPTAPAAPATIAPTAVAPSAMPVAGGMSRARKSADRPRARTSDGIRMHNGVPLLD